MDRETRLQQLIDKDDITARKFAYARAADASDPDRMVEQMTEDCVASYQRDVRLEGRAAIRAWYAGIVGRTVSSSHHLSNVEVTFDGPDTATLRCYLLSWQRFDDHPATEDRLRYARYVDTWVRRDDAWWMSSLTCLPAGEFGSGGNLRFGEYLGWDA
jgi:ketosteroid isomerase-like protein